MDNSAKNSILIVDDEKSNLLYLNYILSADYTLYTARDGHEAIARAQEYLPDLILLDVIMPDMDGYAVLAELKASEKTRGIPVVFVSGLNSSEDEKIGLALGAEDYITKPFSDVVVQLRIRNQLKIVGQMRALDKRLRQQALMTEIAQNFLGDIYSDTPFTNTLRMIGEFMEIPQVLMFVLEGDDATLTCRCEWISPELNLPTRVGDKLVIREPLLSVIREMVVNEKYLCMKSSDPSFQKIMTPYRKNFRDSYLITPIFTGGRMRAVLDYSRDDGREWEESEINLATLVASILSGVFERSAMERQSSIVENSRDFILYIGPDGGVEYVNPAVTAVTGYTRTELLTDGLSVIFDERVISDMINIYVPRAVGEGMAAFETGITRKDGQARILTVSMFTTGGLNFGLITKDVTEIRKLESELIASKELAEQGSRAKSAFLSRMSHEIRTPMNAIIGMTNLAQSTDDPNKIKDCLAKADEASHRLLRLIDDILYISDMEGGRFSLAHAEFSFADMLQSILDEADSYTREKHQILAVYIDPSIPEILIGDEKRLRQVMRNLLENASKFTHDSGLVQFKAFAVSIENEILTVQIEVADNGIGISREQLEVIFTPFEQIDGGVSRRYGGSGLGLPISQKIIGMMDGEIWVESEPDQGSKFAFTFKVRMKAPDSAGDAPASFQGKTVMIADDVEINREIVMSILEDSQAQIVCASNGREAFELFAAEPWKFNAILMDINMPEMDGMEATRRIRAFAVPEGQTVPIIAMTANILPEDVKHYLETGMTDHIGKPIDVTDFMHKLSLHIR